MADLAADLPRLLPKAIAWAEGEAAVAETCGSPLSAEHLWLARAVGVRNPERIRLVQRSVLPFPTDQELSSAALGAGLLGPEMDGVTLGYAIYIVAGHVSNRLISHECRHVSQYESAGSIAAFLPVYLQQIVDYGYEQAPLEIDARAHEIDVT